MKSKRLSSVCPRAVLRFLPMTLLLNFAPAIPARADDPIVSCSALDIDFADSGAKKECRKDKISSGTWIGVRQSLVAKGPGYVLIFMRVKAGHNSYMGAEDATSVASKLGQEMSGSSPIISSRGPVGGFDVATFVGNSAGGKQITCFAFSRYQGMVPSRGGFNGAPGHSTAYWGIFCSGSPIADSDPTIAKILGELQLPSD